MISREIFLRFRPAGKPEVSRSESLGLGDWQIKRTNSSNRLQEAWSGSDSKYVAFVYLESFQFNRLMFLRNKDNEALMTGKSYLLPTPNFCLFLKETKVYEIPVQRCATDFQPSGKLSFRLTLLKATRQFVCFHCPIQTMQRNHIIIAMTVILRICNLIVWFIVTDIYASHDVKRTSKHVAQLYWWNILCNKDICVKTDINFTCSYCNRAWKICNYFVIIFKAIFYRI
jgi:hypothetical protein